MKWSRKKCLWILMQALDMTSGNGVDLGGVADCWSPLDLGIGNEKDVAVIFEMQVFGENLNIYAIHLLVFF
jgi:hypothetical protein